MLLVLKDLGTPRLRKAIMGLMPSEGVKRFRDILNIFRETAVEILETKREALRRGDKALAAQIGKGKDIISILCALLFFFLLHSAHKNDIQ